jgi:hypothetical protein
VLAKLLNRGTQVDAYTEKVDRWVKKVTTKPDAALRNKAKHVLQRILSEDIELDKEAVTTGFGAAVRTCPTDPVSVRIGWPPGKGGHLFNRSTAAQSIAR